MENPKFTPHQMAVREINRNSTASKFIAETNAKTIYSAPRFRDLQVISRIVG